MWTASAATTGEPAGCCRRSSGWTIRSRTPSSPGDLIVATTVPTTRASCTSALPAGGDPVAEAGVRLQVLAHLAVQLGDDAGDRPARRPDPRPADLDRRLDVGHRAPEQQVGLAAQPVRDAELEQPDVGALHPGV